MNGLHANIVSSRFRLLGWHIGLTLSHGVEMYAIWCMYVLYGLFAICFIIILCARGQHFYTVTKCQPEVSTQKAKTTTNSMHRHIWSSMCSKGPGWAITVAKPQAVEKTTMMCQPQGLLKASSASFLPSQKHEHSITFFLTCIFRRHYTACMFVHCSPEGSRCLGVLEFSDIRVHLSGP